MTDCVNVTEKVKFFGERLESIVVKGENAGLQHFLLFPQCFYKASSRRLLKVVIVWYRVKSVPRDKILDQSKLKAFAEDKDG